jgi:hypothetical protein
MAGVVAAVTLLLVLAAGMAPAATNTYLVGSGQTYATIQSALNVARTNNATTDTQIVRIMDSSGSYTNEDLALSATWSTRKLILEANAGQTPTLYRILLNQAINEVTLKGLKFRSPKAGASPNGAVEVNQQGTGTGLAPITITNCNFEQTGNAGGQGWTAGVYIRASDAAGTFGKITVATCKFDMTAGGTSSGARGVTTAYMDNKANAEVYDCVFLGGKHGVADDCSAVSPSMVAMNVHNNLFHSQNFAGYYKLATITSSLAYMTVENNTFVKNRDRVDGYGAGGAISLRGSAIVTGTIKDNLIVDDEASTANAGIGYLATAATECNADYNAFVAMTANKVAFWNNALKTLTDLNGLTGASGNIENDTLTPANLFANYGGTDYRNDYRLKVGAWALTAASDSSYVGAFGQQLPVVTVTANDNTATEAGPTTGQFTVGRGTRTDGALAVNFTLSGSATPGGDPNDYTLSFSGDGAVDYTAKTGSVTIADGATNATITVTPFNDTAVEPDETVVLTLSSQAGYLVGSPSSNTVTITSDDVGNLAPVVNAGASQNVVVNTLPTGNVTLNGSATDDGQLAPMTYQWSKQSGPGTVTFPGGATVTNTTATFDAAGAYVLQLVAYDGGLYGTGTVTVTVYTNSAPVVDAGSDRTVTLASTVNLAGSLVTDDGLPTPPPAVAYAWSQASGVGTVTFGNSTNLATTATFDQIDTYVLQLAATDGLGLSGTDTVTIAVRDVATFTAVTNASFNAADTWTPVGGPPQAGDTAIITDKTVTASNSAHIAGGTIVNVSATGNLTLAASGGTWSGFTISVLTGGTWWVRTGNTIQTNVTATLAGGRLYLEGQYGSPAMYGQLTVASASTLEIDSGGHSFFSPIAHGAGRLTIVGGNVDGRMVIGLAAGSTWTGDWNLAFTGSVRNVDGTQITNTFARGLRLGPGASLSSLFGGTALLPGTLTGFGELTGYQTFEAWIIGAGGTLSPGDAGVSNGVGNLKCSSSSNYNATLTLAANSTYAVDIAGTTADLQDRVTVRDTGNGTGTGIVQIATGAILTVNLWTPPGVTTLNAKIIDTATGTGGEGVLTGAFSVTNWVNASGWRELAVVKSNNDLYVTGYAPPSGTVIIIR